MNMALKCLIMKVESSQFPQRCHLQNHLHGQWGSQQSGTKEASSLSLFQACLEVLQLAFFLP